MNRFRTLLIWQMFKTDEYLQQFDYYLNVDADLFVLTDMTADPLQTMAEKKCTFFTGREQRDAVGCYEGQKEATLEFASAHGVKIDTPLYPDNVQPIEPGVTFWGGFNAADIRFFTTEAHLKYADYINEIGKIYTMRWNDQGHFPLAIALMHEQGLGSVCHDPGIFDNEQLRKHHHGGASDPAVKAACVPDW